MAEQEALVRHRARWIRDKLAVVNLPQSSDDIVTGSRLRYAGRTYFTQVKHTPKIPMPRLAFTASRFVIENPTGRSISLETLAPLMANFYRERAEEKLLVRVRHWERQTGLKAHGCTHPGVPEPLGQLRYPQCVGVPSEGNGAPGQRSGLHHRPRALPHRGEEPHQGFLVLGGTTSAGLAATA